MHRSRVWLPRLDVLGGASFIRDIGRVVLVGQPREVMAELVHEHVLGVRMIDRRGCLEVEDAAAAVLLLVDEHLDELVRRR